MRLNGITGALAGFDAAREELLRLARRRFYGVLATAATNGQPESAPVRYAVSDAFEIVFGTLTSSRKYANLQSNAQVAFLIWDEMHSLQIEGVVDELAGSDLERLAGLFAGEFPHEARVRAGRARHRFHRIVPHWVRYTDFTEEPGRVLTIDLRSRTEVLGNWPVTSD